MNTGNFCNKASWLASSAALFIFLVLPPLFAQPSQTANKWLTLFNGQSFEYPNLSSRASVIQSFNNTGILETFVLDPAEVVEVIVSFSEAPLTEANKQNKNPSLSLARVEQQHARFQADLQNIFAQMQSRSNLPPASLPAIYREYKNVFNGVALRATREIIDEIRKLDYVRAISEDVEVEAYLKESVPLIRADRVWTEFKIHGENIIVGVIDTGIDYQHPSLGNGFGPGFKVIGGYDFVNNDNDPMDDNGHGTHVAGIVAADGDAIKGIAPKAKLLAYKVLGTNGRGETSDVIAAIERAVDPDQNPNTDDAVDILNLSLGSGGYPDDPKSKAIDAATDAGIVCVISAGNSGGYLTISSPGTARKAITVGASDKSNRIASFSSKGLNPNSYEIKPEVVAPGVDITSTWLGQSYRALSGTSMAAPHVAGLAALLRQLHPAWPPEMIKAAIVNGTVDIKAEVYSQGAGRIDAYNSVTKRTLIKSAVASFGADQVTQAVWQKTLNLEVVNLLSQPQEYSAGLVTALPNGIDLKLSPSNFSLAELASQSVQVSVEVNNSLLPFPSHEPFAYSGVIGIKCGADSIRIPWALLKATTLQFTFTEPPFIIYVHNRGNFWRSFRAAQGDSFFAAILPPGTYDAVALYAGVDKFSPIIIKENVHVVDFAEIDISTQNATNTLKYEFRDENGKKLVTHAASQQLLHKASGFAVNLGNNDLTGEHYFSNISSSYTYRWLAHTAQNAKKFYCFGGHLDGVSENRDLSSRAQELKHVQIHYSVSDSIKQIFLLAFTFMHHPDPLSPFPNAYLGFGSALSNMFEQPMTRPFLQEAYFADTDVSNLITGVSLWGYSYDQPPFNVDFPGQENSNILFTTPIIIGSQNHHLKGYARGYPGPQSVVFDEPIEKLEFGLAPPFWFGRFQNDGASIRIQKSRGDFDLNHFVNPMFDSDLAFSPPYRVYQNGVLVNTGVLPIAWNTSELNLYPLDPLGKTLEIEFPYSLRNGFAGKSMVQANFNPQGYVDLNPPYLGSFAIFSNGNRTHSLIRRGHNQLHFTLYDDDKLDSVKTLIQNATRNNATWSELPIQSRGDSFFVDLATISAQKGIYNLRLLATDGSKNSLSMTQSPAFMIGNLPILLSGAISPNFVQPGDSVTLQVAVHQPDSVKLINVEIESPDHTILNTLTLFNDGLHGDEKPNDRIFGNHWVTLNAPRDYVVDVTAVSVSEDSLFKDNFIAFTTANNVDLSVDTLSLSYEDSVRDNFANPGEYVQFQAQVRNRGRGLASDVKVKLLGFDNSNFIEYFFDTEISYGNIEPDSKKAVQQGYGIKISESCPDSLWRTLVFRLQDASQKVWYSTSRFLVRFPIKTGVAQQRKFGIPATYELAQNYPNPFNPSTVIEFALPKATAVKIRIFDMIGREVRALVDENLGPGYMKVVWDGRDNHNRNAPSGIYFYKLNTPVLVLTRKMLLLR